MVRKTLCSLDHLSGLRACVHVCVSETVDVGVNVQDSICRFRVDLCESVHDFLSDCLPFLGVSYHFAIRGWEYIIMNIRMS